MRRNTETKVFMNSLLNHEGHDETKNYILNIQKHKKTDVEFLI